MTRLQLLILLAALFPVSHIVLSHGPIRRGLVRLLGEWPFRGLYSLIALGTAGGVTYVYWGDRHLGAVLWELPHWLEMTLSLPLMLLALVLVVLSFATPSPASMAPVRAEARGVLHITRHPMNIGFACFGLAHMAANGCLGDVCYFGSFAVLGLVGAYHLDRRKAQELGEPFRAFQQQTSVLPFAAMFRGRTRLPLSELRWPVLLVAVAGYVVLLLLHGRLFGPAIL